MELELLSADRRFRFDSRDCPRGPFTDRLVHKFELPVDGWRGEAFATGYSVSGAMTDGPQQDGDIA